MKSSKQDSINKQQPEAPLPPPEKGKPPSSTKDLFIGPETGTGETVLKRFLPIIEMVVKKEYKTIPSYLAEYSELINVGLLTVNKLLNDVVKNQKNYNSSYIAQAVKWAIKDELRSKYNWYGVKQTQTKEKSHDADSYPREIAPGANIEDMTEEDATERIFETILYLEDFNRETALPEQMTTDELARLELLELKAAVKRAVDKLPPKHKKVIELRFYEGKRGNDIASSFGVTPSRISHMIQDAIEKVKVSLREEGYS